MRKSKFRTIKIREKDYKKIKKWAAIRDMYIYDVVHFLINPPKEDK